LLVAVEEQDGFHARLVDQDIERFRIVHRHLSQNGLELRGRFIRACVVPSSEKAAIAIYIPIAESGHCTHRETIIGGRRMRA
jgi:hypothetical protein